LPEQQLEEEEEGNDGGTGGGMSGAKQERGCGVRVLPKKALCVLLVRRGGRG